LLGHPEQLFEAHTLSRDCAMARMLPTCYTACGDQLVDAVVSRQQMVLLEEAAFVQMARSFRQPPGAGNASDELR